MKHNRFCFRWINVIFASLAAILVISWRGISKADLIGYWPMDERTGGTVSDQSGNGFDGTLEGTTDWADGMFGSGLEFFGDGDHVEILDDPILRFSDADSFSAMAWIFVPENSGSGWRGIVNKSRDAAPWWGIWIDPQDQWVYGESGNFLRTPIDQGWHHVAIVQDADGDTQHLYVNGQEERSRIGTVNQDGAGDLWFGGANSVNEWFIGIIDEVRVYDEALTEAQIAEIMSGPDLGTQLEAGDADQDLDFDQLDLVRVQIAAKYLSGQAATWGEGDWNGAPGGEPGNPPQGDGFFDQIDIIAALTAGNYLTGPYAAIRPGGLRGDQRTSIIYDATSGELAVDAPAGTQLTSINIDSAAGVFTGDPAQNLGGSFDNDADNNIFKATFGGSFGSITFGNVARSGLDEAFVLNDLSVVGSLAGGGDLGEVDLIYIPEPSAMLLLLIGSLYCLGLRRSRVKRSICVLAVCIGLVTLSADISRAALTDGLVGYWPLDGLDATDASGNGLDGIVNGDVDTVEDRLGVPDGAMLFPGLPDSHVDLGDEDAFQITGAMTLAAWVTLDSANTNNGRIVAKQAGGGSRSWSLNIESGGSPATFHIAADGGTIVGVSDVDELPMDQWVHMAGVYRPGQSVEVYVDGVLKEINDVDVPDEQFSENGQPVLIGARNACGNCGWLGAIDDVAIWDRDLSSDEIQTLFQSGIGGGTLLRAGDADMDLDFDQLDLVRVQIAAKYLTGQSATWGEGDWDGAPGGTPGDPPAGNGLFDQLDIIAALGTGTYLTGPYAAVNAGGQRGDAQTSILYDAGTGELAVDSPVGRDLTSINIDSAAGIFSGDPAQNLGGSFDNDADNNIFKATFGGSFGALSFGNVAQTGLSEQFVLSDLSVVGSLAGGGDLGPVDLIYVPEPPAMMLAIFSAALILARLLGRLPPLLRLPIL